jgi:hypothetical protein
MFDGVIAWGLIFLLPAEEQRRLIQRIANILVSSGRLLFTSCVEPLVWNDAMTGLESRSLGAAEYRRLRHCRKNEKKLSKKILPIRIQIMRTDDAE